jgi:hypothetical protein
VPNDGWIFERGAQLAFEEILRAPEARARNFLIFLNILFSTNARQANHSFGFLGGAHLPAIQRLAQQFGLEDLFMFVEVMEGQSHPETLDNTSQVIKLQKSDLLSKDPRRLRMAYQELKRKLLLRVRPARLSAEQLGRVAKLALCMHRQAPEFHKGDRARVKLVSPVFLKLAPALWQGSLIPLVERSAQDYVWLLFFASSVGAVPGERGAQCIQVTVLGSFTHSGWWKTLTEAQANQDIDFGGEGRANYARLSAMIAKPEDMPAIDIDLYSDAVSDLVAPAPSAGDSDDDSSEESFVMD